MLVRYFIPPIFFIGIIYLLGSLPVTFFSFIFPFLQGKEYIFIFVLFIISLKFWSKKRWNQEKIWLDLGFTEFRDNIKNPIFKRELYKSFLIILFWSLILILRGYITFKNSSDYVFLLDILFTAVFVGVAEELLFRVWLFEELKLFFNKSNTILIESLIFSLAHPYNSDESLIVNFLMKIGLLLLGTYLSLLRVNNYPNIFPSIAFHGGIVGFIFLAKSVFVIERNYPYLIYGNQYENFINPISGFLGLFTLLILNIYQIKVLNNPKN